MDEVVASQMVFAVTSVFDWCGGGDQSSYKNKKEPQKLQEIPFKARLMGPVCLCGLVV